MFERTVQGEDRTNNFVEAAHQSLYNELGVFHPTIWRFIDSLKKTQRRQDYQLEQLIAGNPPRKKAKKYIRADERMQRTALSYDSRRPIWYLRGMAHCFNFSS